MPDLVEDAYEQHQFHLELQSRDGEFATILSPLGRRDMYLIDFTEADLGKPNIRFFFPPPCCSNTYHGDQKQSNSCLTVMNYHLLLLSK